MPVAAGQPVSETGPPTLGSVTSTACSVTLPVLRTVKV